MSIKPESGLYLIATPIGAADDITLRAIQLLNVADLLLAEDTRSLRKLMMIHGIAVGERKMIACHDHNERQLAQYAVDAIAQGAVVVYASEAGTPLISDPGYVLARHVIEAKLSLFAAPGPSAVLCALAVSGLPSDRFFFAGFPPNTQSARRQFLKDISAVPATLILYESPKRIAATIEDCVYVFSSTRRAVIARELTKKFETILRGTLQELLAIVQCSVLKGEIVLLIDRVGDTPFVEADLDVMILQALKTNSLKDTVALVADRFSVPRRDVYQRALDLSQQNLLGVSRE